MSLQILNQLKSEIKKAARSMLVEDERILDNSRLRDAAFMRVNRKCFSRGGNFIIFDNPLKGYLPNSFHKCFTDYIWQSKN